MRSLSSTSRLYIVCCPVLNPEDPNKPDLSGLLSTSDEEEQTDDDDVEIVEPKKETSTKRKRNSEKPAVQKVYSKGHPKKGGKGNGPEKNESETTESGKAGASSSEARRSGNLTFFNVYVHSTPPGK